MRDPLRIAVVHSFYSSSQPSGENRVVEDQCAALQEAGHHVQLVRRDTDSLQRNAGYQMRTGASLLVGRGFDPTSELLAFRPDLVHIHNLFPNYGTSWLRRWSTPVVVSLHNYRLVCSNGILFRDGRTCMDCTARNSLPAVVHACYRDSTLATVPVAMSRRRRRRDIVGHADALVTTSELSDATIRGLLGPDVRTAIIPNFSSAPSGGPTPPSPDRRWLAMGRLSPEKGFVELLQAWPASEQLDIVGDGEQWEAVKARSGPNVSLHRSMRREALRRFIQGHVGLLFPSRWLEADPQVIVEAVRLGIPVVALEGNAVARMIEEFGFGATYTDGESLAAALAQVAVDRERMSQLAVAAFDSRWSKQAWLASITSLYREVLSHGS